MWQVSYFSPTVSAIDNYERGKAVVVFSFVTLKPESCFGFGVYGLPRPTKDAITWVLSALSDLDCQSECEKIGDPGIDLARQDPENRSDGPKEPANKFQNNCRAPKSFDRELRSGFAAS